MQWSLLRQMTFQRYEDWYHTYPWWQRQRPSPRSWKFIPYWHVSPFSRTVNRVGMEQIYTIKSSQTSQHKTNYSVTRGVRLLTFQLHCNFWYWINSTCRFQESLINTYVPLKYDRWRQTIVGRSIYQQSGTTCNHLVQRAVDTFCYDNLPQHHHYYFRSTERRTLRGIKWLMTHMPTQDISSAGRVALPLWTLSIDPRFFNKNCCVSKIDSISLIRLTGYEEIPALLRP
jgi:hypothetical protein